MPVLCTTQLPSHAHTKPENLQTLLLAARAAAGGLCCLASLLLMPLWLGGLGGPACRTATSLRTTCVLLLAYLECVCCTPVASAVHLAAAAQAARERLGFFRGPGLVAHATPVQHLGHQQGIEVHACRTARLLLEQQVEPVGIHAAACCVLARLCMSLPPASAAAHQLLLLRPQVDVSACTCRVCQTAASAGTQLLPR